MHELSMDLTAVLRHAVEAGASDVHFKVGQPPVLATQTVTRVNPFAGCYWG